MYLPLLLVLIPEQPEEEGLPPGDAGQENLQLGNHQVQVGGGANSEGLATLRRLLGKSVYGDKKRR